MGRARMSISAATPTRRRASANGLRPLRSSMISPMQGLARRALTKSAFHEGNRMIRSISFGLLAFALCAGAPALAAEDPTFRIEFKDGVVTPREIEVLANTRIRLELVNAGETPAEFESLELKKEKVLAPK